MRIIGPRDNVDRGAAVVEFTRHLAGEVHHVRVALEHHQLLDLLGAELHDATDVVATEINEHHMLGAFFFIRQKILGEFFILCFNIAAPARASDRAYCNFSIRCANKDFWARANNLKIKEV